MKFLKRLSFVAVGAVMIFSITGMNVFASSISRDGLEFSLTTDKEIYAEDEKITATLSVKNTNSTDITDITMETIIPDGYEVVDESVNIRQIEKLAPSETVELKSVYNSKSINEGSEVSEINESSETSEVSSINEISEISQNDIVNTGDNKSVDNMNKQNEIVDTSDTSSINIIACIVLVCVSSAIIIFSVKRKSGRRLLSLAVCMLLIGNITAIVPIQVNALQTQQKTMTIEENITVNGSPMLLTATVIYKISGDNLFIGDSSEEQVVIYFYKPDGWNEPYINFYSADNSEESAVLADMTEVSDGWYGYIIGNCKTAEVAFTDKNNRIPASDREWIDVSGIMWYKDNKKCNSEEDTDGDGLPDFIELILNSDIDNPDTDGDMIFDGDEVLFLGTDPLSPDTDNNGISDADEDLDTDGLSNMRELLLGTNPLARDSDNDKITDGDEINKYKTDPLKSDTDGDNAEDGWEIRNEYDPLIANSSFNVTLTAKDEENNLNAFVTVEVIGSQVESLNAEFLENTFYMNPTIPGYIGKGLELSVNDEVDNAELEFTFDESLLENEDFIPTIYYYNEDTQCLEELETTTTDNVSKAHLTHFSVYILLNKREFESVWNEDIRKPNEDIQNKGLAMSFVIDRSASMDWNDPNYLRTELTKNFIDKLDENEDKGSVISFIAVSEVLTELTNDKVILKNAVDSIVNDSGYNYNSGTNGSAGIKNALDQLQSDTEDHEKYIIFMTDGDDTRISYSYDFLIDEANKNDVIIYTIGLGNVDDNLLKKVAEGTGGKYYYASEMSELIDAFEQAEQETIDYQNDKNKDDISDYYTKKLTSGELRYGTHAYVFGTYDENGEFYPATYEEVQDNDNFDGDYLKNGGEVQVDIDSLGHPYVKFKSDPSNTDSDGDTYLDGEDLAPLTFYRNPVLLIHGREDNSLGCFGLKNSIEKTASGNEGYNYQDTERFYTVKDQNIMIQASEETNEYKNSIGENLIKSGYIPNKNLFVFNYPNQDVTYINAQLLQKYIENLIVYKKYSEHDEKSRFFATEMDWQNNTVKFDIVAHSNGGLVSRYYIENYGYDDYVRKLITIDTPHYGCIYANIGSSTMASLTPWVVPMDFELSNDSRLFTGNVNIYFFDDLVKIFQFKIDSVIGGETIIAYFHDSVNYALNHQSPQLQKNDNVSTKYYAIGGWEYGMDALESPISVEFKRNLKSESDFTQDIINQANQENDVSLQYFFFNKDDNIVDLPSQFGVKNFLDDFFSHEFITLHGTTVIIYGGSFWDYNLTTLLQLKMWHIAILRESVTHAAILKYLEG